MAQLDLARNRLYRPIPPCLWSSNRPLRLRKSYLHFLNPNLPLSQAPSSQNRAFQVLLTSQMGPPVPRIRPQGRANSQMSFPLLIQTIPPLRPRTSCLL